MKYTQLLLSLGVVVASATAALAKPAYVAGAVNLRAAPGTTSEVVAKIPAGSLVDADNCTEGWCAVTWQDKSGFAIATSLDMSGRVPQPRRTASSRPPRNDDGYVPVGPDEVVEGPVYYGRPGPYYGPYYGGPYYGPYGYYGGWRHRW
jgi:uncharacterized protein YraI